MSTSRKSAATLSLIARLSVPFLAATGGAVAQGCLFGSPGPSNVALGKLYVSGESQYDQFFSELYQVQLPMGQATDREANNRARVANALGVPPDSPTEQIADALDQRALALGKAGLTLKVQASGLDTAATPSAELLATGSPPKPADQALMTALALSLKDDAALIADLRRDRPRIERLKPMADALEPGIDVTFRKGGAPKKAEVRKNVEDAQRMVPLMAQRSGDVEHRAAEFILKIQKVVGAPPSAAPPPSPAPPPVEPVPPTTAPKKGSKGSPAAAHGDATSPKPKAAHSEPKADSEEAPEPKPAAPKTKPPADDFEP